LDGSKVPKTIAELRVDIENAMTPLSDLQKQFDTLDKQIEKTQAGMAGLGKPAATGAKGMTAAAVATKNFNKEIEKQSVLASQWERKISWFIEHIFALFQYKGLLLQPKD
jgi:chromosome segregation ATPase